MIKVLAARAAKYIGGLARRFLTNKPSNTYETIAFSAVRSAAYQFGRAV